jgi:hypothetical protein
MKCNNVEFQTPDCGHGRRIIYGDSTAAKDQADEVRGLAAQKAHGERERKLLIFFFVFFQIRSYLQYTEPGRWCIQNGRYVPERGHASGACTVKAVELTRRMSMQDECCVTRACHA